MSVSKAWTADEIDAGIGLYFSMLGLSLNGLKFNKRAMIRLVQGVVDTETGTAGTGALAARSRQSVEMKLMNITACINDIARERGTNYQSMENAGYKPLNSYQAALRLAVSKCTLQVVNERPRRKRYAGTQFESDE